jgi:DNA polymerase III sliding clamp (beta) subunit (PCNA family)
MRARIERDELRSLVRAVMPAVDKRASGLDALWCLRIETTRSSLAVTASNIDLTIESSTAAIDYIEPGVVLAPASRLAAAVDRLGDGAVTLTAGEGTLTVAGSLGSVTLRTVDPQHWPTGLDLGDEEVSVVLDADALDVLRRVAPFCSTDPSRPILCGVTFDPEAGTAVATDSYAMAVGQVKVELPACIVPGPALSAVLAAAGDGPVTAVVDADHRRIELGVDRTRWVVRLIAADPIDYGRMLPSDMPHQLTTERSALLDALDLADVVLNRSDGVPAVRLSADGSGTLDVTATQTDVGDVDSTVDADGEIGITVSTRLMRQALRAIDDERVTVQTTDALKPLRIDSERLTLLVMPVRVS